MNFDPYSPMLHEDPYPVYRRLRDEIPVFYNPELSFWRIAKLESRIREIARGGRSR